jgi:hypothetical protein
MTLVAKSDDIAFVFMNNDGTYTVGENYKVILKNKEVIRVKTHQVSKTEGEALAKILKKNEEQLTEYLKKSGKLAPLQERDLRHYDIPKAT